MSQIEGLPPPDASPKTPMSLPLPATPSPSSQSRIPIPTPQTLRTWLPIYFKKTDATIAHLNRILSTPSGTDTLLLTLCYSSLATSTLLSRISLHRLHNNFLRLLSSLASSLPANTTVLLTPATIQAPRLLRISQSLKALSELISDFRVFARLWGLLGIWRWGKGLVGSPPRDAVLQRIAWAQVSVNVAFQVLENGAYLASKGVLGWDSKKQGKAWLWSSRFWAAHVGLEFVRLAYLRSGTTSKGKGTEKEGEEGEKAWRRDLIVNLAYAPLTVHWSREGGLVGDLWVGVLGTVAGIASFTELWKNTA